MSDDWVVMADATGRQFFYNSKTQVSTWDVPPGYEVEDNDNGGDDGVDVDIDVLAQWLSAIGMERHRDIFGDIPDASQLFNFKTEDLIRRGVPKNDAEFIDKEIKILKKQFDGADEAVAEEDAKLTPLQRQQRQKARDDEAKRGPNAAPLDKQQSQLLKDLRFATKKGLESKTQGAQKQLETVKLKTSAPKVEKSVEGTFSVKLKSSDANVPLPAAAPPPPTTTSAAANTANFGVNLRSSSTSQSQPQSTVNSAVTAATTSAAPQSPQTLSKKTTAATTSSTTPTTSSVTSPVSSAAAPVAAVTSSSLKTPAASVNPVISSTSSPRQSTGSVKSSITAAVTSATAATAATAATTSSSSSSAKTNNSDPLAVFLKGIGLEECLPKLKAEKVDMQVLSMLSDEELKGLGLALGERKKILLALKK